MGQTAKLLSRWPVFTVVALAVAALLLGAFGGTYQGKLGEVQKNDNASYLPGSAESTVVANESTAFLSVQSIPGFVLFDRDSGLTDDDKRAIEDARRQISGIDGVDGKGMTPPQYSADGQTAALYVPLVAKADGVDVSGDALAATEETVVDTARGAVPDGVDVLPAGPGGLLVAFIDAFAGLDGALLGAALLVVVLILLVVYRSPVLWVFPILSAVLAVGLASVIIYYLAKHDVLTLTGQSQGILFVLVIGAGTDYALLLIARYREELHAYPSRFDAMARAWKESAPAILASAGTVIIGLLCLMFSELNSNKSLGPVAAIGIACTVLVMMTFLPVALSLCGRWVFWPRRPDVDDRTDLATHGLWGRVAAAVERRHRPAWIGATVLLLLCLVGITSLDTDGLTTTENFTNEPEAVVGQQLYTSKFDPGTGAPAVIVTSQDSADDVIRAAERTQGVAQEPGSVCVQVDFAKLADLIATVGPAALAGQTGCPPPSLQVQPVDGRILINATLADAPDSPAALDTVERLRANLHGIDETLVGGNSAATVDVQAASVHDRNLIIPIVLVVIFVVLSILLRALLIPLILIATVVLSFAATLGVSGWMFSHVFHFAGADQSFPLFAFVFLVALGIDYNIFLMTRVREETLGHGTRPGILRGLAVTGGVITSAGVVLAATFAVLGVLPLVFLAEIGFAVAFGVLLDTIVVRSILVPALSYDIGRAIWWPSALARRESP
ncbi:MMPL family transporter [Rhodococcus sp. BP-252]|uniref:MMPL family transporter n=1 Tax=unclassified Rhodococcus (in: high G+C Gram-positive bacteria) TaxID=192944 RepID=UPI001431AB76|nr:MULTISPECIES: MMPL family transporter [unclassified Rhodococcus (in: high G+C Gram-positive bacteria)]MBY6414590.1 MMPL family transporter [Rhodococcus sp. BP-320]MBY6419347.1 MMPL family transporter [Rhodococcus sp. BP-321]MBY6424329.1 MMPL family transporter [Rhodococcus sp. BP-324]MBY6429426.1 MMPL family transporter [Rhodococcus sp. BP-323]MBY6431945.1 MMPL family transporter [Rhodococcus sp. BP-322]